MQKEATGKSESQHLKDHLKVKDKENAEIRDTLAHERTELANERTFLAYIRTAMGLVLAGFSLIQFFRHQVFVWIGVALIPAGFFVGIVGLKRFITKRRSITSKRQQYTPTSTMHAQVAVLQNKEAEN